MQYITLEHPTDVIRHLTTVVGKNKIKEIRFGYRLQDEQPAIKFKIWLRFPYNWLGRKQIEEKVEEEMSHLRLKADLPSTLLYQVE
jgi:hypothetical protein